MLAQGFLLLTDLGNRKRILDESRVGEHDFDLA